MTRGGRHPDYIYENVLKLSHCDAEIWGSGGSGGQIRDESFGDGRKLSDGPFPRSHRWLEGGFSEYLPPANQASLDLVQMTKK